MRDRPSAPKGHPAHTDKPVLDRGPPVLDTFPVVAIGASAGGLQSCRTLLKALPDNPKMAFVLILHLDPTHESMMVDLLARNTTLTVVEAADSMAVEPGCLYIIPPGAYLSIADGVLHLSAPTARHGARMPFDFFLNSLAQDMANRAVCIVLSGTGTDGSAGLAAIRAAGGVVIVQDPGDADYPGMPNSAIQTGQVDHILTAADMPPVLAGIADDPGLATETGPDTGPAPDSQPDPHPGTRASPVAGTHVDLDPDSFNAIVDLVRSRASQDVALYKTGTIQRRIVQRMAMCSIPASDSQQYLHRLKSDSAELDRLAADLLIHVTGFFRDTNAFDRLASSIIPELLQARPANQPLRVWVAGCSTGEEAYSIGILCLEAIESQNERIKLQILASDIDADAIATAREGFYPDSAVRALSQQRLEQFFSREIGGWRVQANLRDKIVFTVQDLLSDPPFSRIDLVTCRNLLIYLGAEGQRRAIGMCSFALRPGGFLMLGSSETPGAMDGRFESADKAARIWRRVGNRSPGDLKLVAGVRPKPAAPAKPADERHTAYADICRQHVAAAYAPAAALLNRRLECLYLLGPTDRYLRLAPGYPNHDFLAMTPKALRVRLRAAAASCTAENPVVTVVGGRTDTGIAYSAEIRAIAAEGEDLLLICFLDEPSPPALAPAPDTSSDPDPSARAERERALEAELETVKAELSAALNDLETAAEEHSADAAEALSINEEYQSTNEELLASKEELQSLNEELNALNGQLQETLERHRTTANDLQNVLYSTDVATVFLDTELKIRFFTPAMRTLFHIIPTDIGRPLADFAGLSSDAGLLDDAAAVLEGHETSEREILAAGETWYQRRIQPYRVERTHVEGVVITYTDITERRKTAEALDAARLKAERADAAKSRFLAAASHDLRQPLQSLALLHKLLVNEEDETQRRRLSALQDRTLASMTDMLDALLDINRIDAGAIEPKITNVPMAPLIQRLIEDHADLAAEYGLKLRGVPSSVMVRSDPRLLEQMLRNLLSNAMKYTPKGGIVVGCRRRGDQVSIEVWDSGIGIAKSDQSAIFEAYHRIKDSAPGEGRIYGLGLGLPIVQHLCDILGHRISLRSSVGKGSGFAIEVPTSAQPDGAAASADHADPINGDVSEPRAIGSGLEDAEPAAPDMRGATILLVEDEPDLLELLAAMLTAEGHHVVATRDAAEALLHAVDPAAPPDLLLTDFYLHTGFNGVQLASAIAGALGRPIPTIVLTGDITTAALRGIENSNCQALAKPTSPETLNASIASLLQPAPSQPSPDRGQSADRSGTIHIIDDDPIIRDTSQRLFLSNGWASETYDSAEAFLAAPRPSGVDCLLVDARLPGMDGVALLALLKDEGCTVPSIMITGHGDAAMAVAAMKSGASDLIEKPANPDDLIESVARAIEQAQDSLALAQSRQAAAARFAELTRREEQVLEKVLAGVPNKNIAADLGVSQRTVENHRASVMQKTGTPSLPALVRLALAAGR